MYNKYLELKQYDSSKLYLFKSGAFYIFIEDDAITINKYVNLKLTNLGNEHIKCGFPQNSYDKYMNILKRLNLNIEEVSSSNRDEDIISKIKNIDMDTLINTLEVIRDLKNKYGV